MESNGALKETIEKLVDVVKVGQAHNKQVLDLLDQRVTANREAVEAMNQLINKHTLLLTTMRQVVIRLFEDRYGSEGVDLPDWPVN